MDDMKNDFIDARLNANETQVDVSIKIGCGLSVISQLETHGKEPMNRAVLRNIEEYIMQNKPQPKHKKGVKK